jgi:hypothetical protein
MLSGGWVETGTADYSLPLERHNAAAILNGLFGLLYLIV